MHQFKFLVAMTALLLLVAGEPLVANPKVKDVKVVGDPARGSLFVKLGVDYTPPAPGDIVFLYVNVGQDEPVLIARGTSGTFSGKVPTTKTWASLKETTGNKPFAVRVHACLTYNEDQAKAWIRNQAAETVTATTIFSGGSPANDDLIKTLKPAMVVGTYRRFPIENSWHIGEIRPTKGGLMWTNKEGVSWKLTIQPKTGLLESGMDNPYFKDVAAGDRDFKVKFRRDASGKQLPQVDGFYFLGELYRKTGK